MSEARSLRVEAVVLRHTDWGEADRLLTLYSREAGKLRAVAKGIRRLRSRKAGHLEPFTRVALMLARGREMWIVTQAETVNAYLGLAENLQRTGYAAYVMEILDRFTFEEGANRLLYQLLVDTLQRVSASDDPFVPVRYYDLRMLDLLGFRPQLFECVGCGQAVKPENQYFSAEQGGVLCPNCGSEGQGWRVSMNTLRYLRHFQRSSYAEAARAGIPAEVRSEMEALLQNYLTYLLERGLNTPGFLREVRNIYPAE